MPNQEEVNHIIEQAKKNKGIDMSWLRPPTSGIESISPGASQLMEAVRQAQATTPVYIPFAPGTPTQRRREAEESKRQFDVGQEFSREQFAADEAYRQAQLALQRLSRTGGGGAGGAGTTALSGIEQAIQDWPNLTVAEKKVIGPTIVDNVLAEVVQNLIYDGATWDEVIDHLLSPAEKLKLSPYLVDVTNVDEEIKRIAAKHYDAIATQMMPGTPSYAPLGQMKEIIRGAAPPAPDTGALTTEQFRKIMPSEIMKARKVLAPKEEKEEEKRRQEILEFLEEEEEEEEEPTGLEKIKESIKKLFD